MVFLSRSRSILALLFLCFTTLAGWASGENPKKKVLVFYPDSDSRPGILAFDRELRQTLHHAESSIEIFNEFLDTSRFPDEAYQQQLAQFLRSKYALHKPDVIVVGLAPALDFILKYRSTICPGVPVVYGAIEKNEIDMRKIDADVIGAPMYFALESTLKLALRLQPGVKRVYVIAGSSPYDQYWLGQARQVFEPYARTLTFSYLSDLSVSDLQYLVSTIPPDGIIYYLHMFRDNTGISLSSAEVVELLAPKASAPIYGHVGTYMGRGIVGGQLMEFEREAGNAATLALQILDGKKPEEVTLPTGTQGHYTVDWRQLQHWDIREADLPPGTIVKFAEKDFWESYKWHVLSSISLCIGEALLIIGLLLQRANRQKAERLFRLSVESAPNGMVLIGHNGMILLANTQMEKLFGYTTWELLGASVELLVPERFRDSHPLLRTAYLKSPTNHLMGAGCDLTGRRKDGSEFPVEIGLNPILTESPFRILATIVDVTERKRVEARLSQNQKELIALTGKLMQAQESERRHIARELHDDLNQNLALLSLELDLLGEKPPESKAQLDETLSHLSSQVKQLSTFVHDLSHQLHPAKVEQLGVVTALRALTRDLSITHECNIDFVANDINRPIPTQVGLCLYRIAQEGIRNAIKHSQAKEIMVGLSLDGEAILMIISDDGKGIASQHELEFSGLGLLSMRERLRLVDGEILIDSSPGQGTRLRVRVPLNDPADDAKSQQPVTPTAFAT